MVDKNIVKKIVENALEGQPMFLVDVSVSSSNDIEVEVDSDERMSIDDCSMLSRTIENQLDRDKEDFSLTVLSSGIGYPFKVFRQYQKAIGKTVEVKSQVGQKVIGILENCIQQNNNIVVTISYDKKEKNVGEKRPHFVRHEDTIEIHDDIEVKEIITIK